MPLVLAVHFAVLYLSGARITVSIIVRNTLAAFGGLLGGEGRPAILLRGAGVMVLESTQALPTFVPALEIDQVIITIGDAPQVQWRWILRVCPAIRVQAQMNGGQNGAAPPPSA